MSPVRLRSSVLFFTLPLPVIQGSVAHAVSGRTHTGAPCFPKSATTTQATGGWLGSCLKPHYSPSSWSSGDSLYFTFHTSFPCVFLSRQKQEGRVWVAVSTWAGYPHPPPPPQVFFKSSLLTCLQKGTQTCLTGWRSSPPSGVPNPVTRTKRLLLSPAPTFIGKANLLRNQTKTSSPWLQPRPYFPFLSNIPFTQMWKSCQVGGRHNLTAPLPTTDSWQFFFFFHRLVNGPSPGGASALAPPTLPFPRPCWAPPPQSGGGRCLQTRSHIWQWDRAGLLPIVKYSEYHPQVTGLEPQKTLCAQPPPPDPSQKPEPHLLAVGTPFVFEKNSTTLMLQWASSESRAPARRWMPHISRLFPSGILISKVLLKPWVLSLAPTSQPEPSTS